MKRLALALFAVGCIDQPAGMVQPDPGDPGPIGHVAASTLPETGVCWSRAPQHRLEGECIIPDSSLAEFRGRYGYGIKWSPPDSPEVPEGWVLAYLWEVRSGGVRESRSVEDTLVYRNGLTDLAKELMRPGSAFSFRVQATYQRAGNRFSWGFDRGPMVVLDSLCGYPCGPDGPTTSGRRPPPGQPDTTTTPTPIPPEPPPPPPDPPSPPPTVPVTCAQFESRVASHGSALYTGQCHSGDWNKFTIDARSEGELSLILSPGESEYEFVCGHSNTEKKPNANGTLLWCSSDLGNEWAKVRVGTR